MKRVIKFRGKDSKTKQWVYGDLLHVGNGCIITTNSELGETLPDGDIGLAYNHDEFAVVIPETVGQFTGQYDKNKKEVYEGDVLRFYDEDTPFEVVVAFVDGALRVVYTRALDVRCSWSVNDMVIIGNIHDNPELLKGGAE